MGDTGSGSSSKSATAEAPSTRWWESYLVRYFVGFIVGAICIAALGAQVGVLQDLTAFLATNTTSGSATPKADWTALTVAVALLGLGYCYIASTPITVLHVARYGQWWPDAQSRHFWLGWLLVLLASAAFGLSSLGNSPYLEGLGFAACAGLILLMPVSKSFESWSFLDKNVMVGILRRRLRGRPALLVVVQSVAWSLLLWCGFGRLVATFARDLDDLTLKMWLLALPIGWIGLVQYLVLIRLTVEQAKVEDFYAQLFAARRRSGAKDVRDTYTHMREHSNSVFIVVVELSMLAGLLALARTVQQRGTGNVLDASTFGVLILIGLALWMVPTVFIWSRANALERTFATTPSKFLGPEVAGSALEPP